MIEWNWITSAIFLFAAALFGFLVGRRNRRPQAVTITQRNVDYKVDHGIGADGSVQFYPVQMSEIITTEERE